MRPRDSNNLPHQMAAGHQETAAAYEELISVEGISKSFLLRQVESGSQTHTEVLAGLSFKIKKGAFVALFGPNGCGKTTLLKILAGLEKPDQGVIRVSGDAQRHIRTSMVFQNYRDSLFPWKNAVGNVAFPLEINGVQKRQRDAMAIELLTQLGGQILSRADYVRYPYQLSGGQQQLLAIARALIVKPDLLLMDESFAALDHDSRYLMQDILLKVWEQFGFFILFVSHSVWEAVYLADYVVLLSGRPGRVLDAVEIPLPRPRTREAEYTPEFFQLRSRILRVFEKELYAKPRLA